MALTDEQRANLEKLATYLEKLPPDYSKFSMDWWVSGAVYEDEARYARENGGVCGTAACAAGHGPAAGILVPERFIDDDEVDWWNYSQLFAPYADGLNSWCFGGSWDLVDNTPHGAAARIRYLLDKDSPPDGYGGEPHRAFKKHYAPYRIDAAVSA